MDAPPDVTVEVDSAPRFANRVPRELLASAVTAAIQSALQDRAFPPRQAGYAVSLRIADDEEMQAINRQYRGVDRPTDVLSFSFVAEQQGPQLQPPRDWPLELGEILLDLPYAERQAADLGHSLETELAWLTIHGALQLLGYAHEDDAEAEHMEALERAALNALGISVE
jgi:probable rRNA maturation factor